MVHGETVEDWKNGVVGFDPNNKDRLYVCGGGKHIELLISLKKRWSR